MTTRLRLFALGLFLVVLSLGSAAGGGRVRVVVLLQGDATAAAKALAKPGDTVLAAPARVGQYTAVRLETTAERAAALASSPGVASVWPWTPPRMHDERSGQILAGAIDASGHLTAPGYSAWLDAR